MVVSEKKHNESFPSSSTFISIDRRHFDLRPDQIPLTESLLDCMNRTTPVWKDKISIELKKGRNVMVVAHANTLRGLVKIIDSELVTYNLFCSS